MIVGDMDSVSDSALTSGAEIVVHAYRDGRASGSNGSSPRVTDAVVFPATGTSEDIAMLLADDKAQSHRRRRHARHARGVPGQGPGRNG